MLQIKKIQGENVTATLPLLHAYLKEILNCTDEELVSTLSTGTGTITLKASVLTHPVLGADITVDWTIYKSAQNPSSIRVLFDEEAQFLMIQQANATATGYPSTDLYFIKENIPCGCIIAHTEKNDGIFRVLDGTNPVDAYALINAPFYLNTNITANSKTSVILNVNESAKDVSSYSGNEFDLVPMYVGLAKIKNLYVCPNNRTNIEKIVTGSDGTEYMCIGNGIFYKL